MSNPIRVLVVDDSALMRTMVHRALIKDNDIIVVGEACDSAQAREMIKRLNPDVVTLDVEMPGMNGIAFLEKIMTLRPMPVIMVSSLTARGTETALAALEIGAVDTIAKPSSPEETRAFGALVRQKARVAASATVQSIAPRAPRTSERLARSPRDTRPVQNLIAIGASTGGVGAVGNVFSKLGTGLPPILVTIHMPAAYTDRFAKRLASDLGRDVAEARDGETLCNGMIRIAPGGRHLEIERQSKGFLTRLGDTNPVTGHCPSVDVMFTSVAQCLGSAATGIIMTGMGRDGAEGLLKMKDSGAVCLGQTEASCVVYGMPKAAKAIGATDRELDPTGLADCINTLSQKRRVPLAI